MAVPAVEPAAELEFAAASAVCPAAAAALAAAAESPDGAPLAVPLVEPPAAAMLVGLRELPPAAVLAVPAAEPPDPPVRSVDAAAAAAAEVGGGERLPGAGKCPPLDPSLWPLFVAGLRAADLAAALLSADAKSLPAVF